MHKTELQLSVKLATTLSTLRISGCALCRKWFLLMCLLEPGEYLSAPAGWAGDEHLCLTLNARLESLSATKGCYDLPEHSIAASLQVLPVPNGKTVVLALTGFRHPIQVLEQEHKLHRQLIGCWVALGRPCEICRNTTPPTRCSSSCKKLAWVTPKSYVLAKLKADFLVTSHNTGVQI